MPQTVFYSYPVYASFVKNDEQLFKKHFRVKSHYFVQTKQMLLFSFIKQFSIILWWLPRTDIYISFFAGYSSFLPGVFSKITGKPHLIILGGTDCSSFPSINYGSFSKKILGWFTGTSLKMATRLAPVAETLIDAPNTYYDKDYPRQGYINFCSASREKSTVVHIGYNSEMFYSGAEKKEKTFLTVANMTAANYFRKGIDLIFEMATRFPDCTYTIVGNSADIKYGAIPQNIYLLPFIKYEELKNLYSTHQFYFQLSIMEGFPSAPCEAMLCECVPITSNVGALPVIVGDTGFILDKRDADQLEKIIQTALNADVKYLGKQARERIIREFPLSTRDKLIEIIKQMIQA
ncbi:MAG: glycosyltransferase family 4 protein [Chitinophagales bacterium]